MRFLRVGLIAALAFAVSGCGAAKPAGSVPAGASFAPASTVVYLTGVTDPASSQWDKADKLLGHFPGRDKLLASARKDLRKDGLTWQRDVKPALGSDVSLALLSLENAGNNVVFFTKPKDEAKFDKFIESGDSPMVHRKIDGWTVFADKKIAIDNFAKARASGESLADKSEFRDAMKSVPKDAALRGYVSGSSLYALINRQAVTDPSLQGFQAFSKAFGTLEFISFSASAEDKGVSVRAVYSTKPELKISNYSAQLVDDLPAGALLYVSFGNLEDYFNSLLSSADKSFPSFKEQRSKFEQALGFSLKDDLFPLFSKEGALAIYGTGQLEVPNVLFELRVPDEKKARHVVDRFSALASLSGGATTRTITVHGVETKQIEFALAGFSIFAAVHDGKAYVTNGKDELNMALGGGKKVSDDAVYKDARDAAGSPGQTAGFVYANLKDGLPYIFDFAENSTPGSITPDVRANTKPLQAVFFYAKKDGKRISLSGFLTIQ